jgi:hypothetical protein
MSKLLSVSLFHVLIVRVSKTRLWAVMYECVLDGTQGKDIMAHTFPLLDPAPLLNHFSASPRLCPINHGQLNRL